MGLKLDKSHIGQKFTLNNWDTGRMWFIPLGLTEDGSKWIGEASGGWSEAHVSTIDNWLPYEPQPKQEVLMSPTIHKIVGSYFLSDDLQTGKPLRVVLKNCKSVTNYSEGRLVDRADIEADLWIKLDGEQS